MKMPSPRQHSAFTLLEVVAVMVMLGLLSTVAVVSLSGTLDRYRLNRAVEMVELFDARARRQAGNQRTPVDASIQLNRNRLLIESPNDTKDRVFGLPSGVQISSVRLSRNSVAGRQLDLRYSRDGVSPTYAIQLQRGDKSHWLVILGISGQIIHSSSEGEVNEILSP